MKKSSSLVLCDKRSYRKIAQDNWGLTDEQMKGMHVHHRIPQSKGGTNDPSNLYVCSPWFHANVWHHGDGSTTTYVIAGELGRETRWKDKPRDQEGGVALLYHCGLSLRDVASLFSVSPAYVGRVLTDFGVTLRSNKRTGRPDKKKRKGYERTPETNQKRSRTMKGVPKKKVICPHCGTTGDMGSLTRWHFDNCKHKLN